MSPHAYVSHEPPNPTTFHFSQSVVKLFQCKIELTHNTQCLHQQMMGALENIARSSMFQENQHFINNVPIFKAKDPQSFDDWLEQINEVAALTNKDP